jgi:hypothetical protein
MKEPKASMDYYTLVHVGARIAYNYLYLTTSKRKSSYLRTAAFQVGLYPAVAILCRAAKVLA